MRDLGAAGAVPAGLGVVEGGELPYRPEALAKKKENLREPAEARPRDQVLSAGRAARDLSCRFRSRSSRAPKHVMMVHEFAGAVRTVYMTDQTEAPADSWMGWSNGRWEGETWSSTRRASTI